MDPVAVTERVHHILAVRDDSSANDAAVGSALVAVREVQAWADAQHAALVSKLSPNGFAEGTIAKAGRTSIAVAAKTRQRAATLAATPGLAGALGDGATTAAHIDVVTRAADQLPAEHRDELLQRADELTTVATNATPD
jgi:hypothetical protein